MNHNSSRKAQLNCFATAALLLVALSRPILLQSARSKATASVRQNGYFRADLGYFFVDGNSLYTYDAALSKGVVWDNVLERYILLQDVEKEIPGKGAPFYEEQFGLHNGEWTRMAREFSEAPKRFLDFGPCDAGDQIDLPDDPLAGLEPGTRRLLPHGSRVKGANDVKGRFTILVTSEDPGELPSMYEPGTYSLRIFVFLPTKRGWTLTASVRAEQFAYYCGMRTIEAGMPGNEGATVLLLYSSVPEGSRIASVSRQIRSFLIRTDAEATDSN